MPEIVYTVGHGNKGLDELVDMLRLHHVRTLVDVRSYPYSKRNPHFNGETLQAKLSQLNMTYEWFGMLGGYRKNGLGAESPNVALRSQGFRNYADYMLTKTFQKNIERLLKLTHTGILCLMCAETLPFRCHRWFLSDCLLSRGVEVVHIIDMNKSTCHKLSKYARVEGKDIFYDRIDLK